MNLWQRQSLKIRLTLAFSISATVLILAFSVMVYEAMSVQLVDVVDVALDDYLDDLVPGIENGDLDLSERDRLAQLFDQDRVLLSRSASVPEGVLLVSPESIDFVVADEVVRTTEQLSGLGFRVRTASTEVASDDGPVVLVVARNLSGVDESRRRILWALGIAAPVIAAGVSVAGWLLIRRVLRPVQAMADRAQLVTADSERLTVGDTAGRDEFNSLAVAFNSLLSRVDEARSHERQFIADVSHELRTPLSIVRAELETLTYDNEPDTDELIGLQNSINEVDRMTRLIERLLLLARADARQLTETPTANDVSALIEALVERLEHREGVTIDVAAATEGPVVFDAEIFGQIFENLASNAIRHARARVLISAKQNSDRTLTLSVADDGPGFADEILDSGTTRFGSGPSLPGDTSRPRVGLGLSIASALCAAVGGTVVLGRSGGLGGGEVRIILPAAFPTNADDIGS